jgi:hypothetical protein
VEKYLRAVQTTDENMAHLHRMLDTQDYKYTRSGCAVLIHGFPFNNGCTNAPQCYVTRALLVLLIFEWLNVLLVTVPSPFEIHFVYYKDTCNQSCAGKPGTDGKCIFHVTYRLNKVFRLCSHGNFQQQRSTDLYPVRQSNSSTRHTFLHKTNRPIHAAVVAPIRSSYPHITCVLKITLSLYHMKRYAINMYQFVDV